jgi:hypothetical protein
MATGGAAGPVHPVRTANHQYQYLFHPKHHGRGGPREAQWLKELSHDQEFGVFDLADTHELLDGKGHLYGFHLGPNQEILELGTLEQQVAMFPRARPDEPWHGYPLSPLRRVRSPHPEERDVPTEVLRRMVERGLLSEIERRRLEKGKRA